jgi:hypothetical protein
MDIQLEVNVQRDVGFISRLMGVMSYTNFEPIAPGRHGDGVSDGS